MSKKLSNEQKLNQINEEHRQLLTKVKESIEQNRNAFLDSITDVMDTLNYDEHEVKKYEALIKAKQLIEDLVNQILSATTVEEIVNLRNRLNNYINKIKKEIVSRHLSDEMLTNYQEKAAYLRKDIAKVIRVLKRDNNINEIDSLVSKETLLSDEKTRLSHLMTNEKRFNQYYLNPKERKKASVIEKTSQEAGVEVNQLGFPVETSLAVIDGSNLLLGSHLAILPFGTSIKAGSLGEEGETFCGANDESACKVFLPESFGKIINAAIDLMLTSVTEYVYENDEEFLISRAKNYERQYGIWSLHEYGSSRLANFCKFFANIPANIANKRITRVMIHDCNAFYSGGDIISFIEYTRKRNSIGNALKSIFSKSYLESFEGQCLNNHRRCAEWLENYCNERELELGYFKRKRVLE